MCHANPKPPRLLGKQSMKGKEKKSMEITQPALLPQFRNYETIKWLGSRGSANTYLVKHTYLKQLRVAKQIKPGIIQQDPVKFQELFKREAETLADLDHPHIVKIHDYDHEQGYLIMDFADGGTLRQLLDNDFPEGMATELRTLLTILEPIVDALTYSHQQGDRTNEQRQGIIHLDLKPSNILIQTK